MSLSIQSCIENKKDLEWSLPEKQHKVVDEILWMASTNVMPCGNAMTLSEMRRWIYAVKIYITSEE